MNDLATSIESTVNEFVRFVKSMDDSTFTQKPNPDKWSKKEILGHLVDSAQNNIQRFVRGQYELLPKIVYAQDDWVKLQNYQQYAKDDLVQLWALLNKHLCRILREMAAENYDNQVDTGKGIVEVHTLKFLAEDYLKHMKHHLGQISMKLAG